MRTKIITNQNLLLLAFAGVIACGPVPSQTGNTIGMGEIKTVVLGAGEGGGGTTGMTDFKGDAKGATAKIPFPQSLDFKATLKPDHKAQDELNQDIIVFYENWKKNYLKCYPGTDITFIEGDFTGSTPSSWPAGVNGISQSEAVGYGMLIFALMAGYDADAKAYFDGLVGLYQANPSRISGACMSWIIPDKYDPSLGKSTSAADGDMDIAYALLLADKQWGNQEGGPDYGQLATTMLEECILGFDISLQTHRVLMGDWGKGSDGGVGQSGDDRFNETSTRPSDWFLGHLKVFDAASPNPRWNKAINEIYRLIAATQNKKTGLLPDFAEDVNGQPSLPVLDVPYTDKDGDQKHKYLESEFDNAYSWNACRVPWRLATDYAHYNTVETKAALDVLNRWSVTLSRDSSNWGGSIWHGYHLDGRKISPDDDWSWALAYTAPMVSALIAGTDPSHQAYLNNGWDFMVDHFLGDQKATQGWSGYYSDTIALLNMLLISGNWWNPAEVD